jgi:transcriptional repressor NrdR
MRCPFCAHDDDKVLETRTLNDGAAMRRRRECLKCSKRFTSYERVEPLPVMVIKRDGRRQEFSVDKVRLGIMHAIEKRPIPMEKIEDLLNKIEKLVYSKNSREIDSSEVGNLIMDELKALDAVAYVRFASVYKQFKTLEEFVAAVNKLG